MKAIVLGVMLLATTVAQAEDRKCIREMYATFGDMKYAKRLCDPKNHVTDPNEYGWMCVVDKGYERVKGAGTKQQKDAPCE